MGICTSTGLRHTMDRPMRPLRIRGVQRVSVTPVTTSRPVAGSFWVSVSDLTCVMECTVEAQIQGRPQMEVRPVMSDSQNMSRWYAPGFLRPAELFTRRVVMFWSM